MTRRNWAWLGLAALVLPWPAAARAELLLTGAAADRTLFVGLLNSFSTGGVWVGPVNSGGALTFAPDGLARNFFARRMGDFAASNTQATLDVGQNQGGVAIGAFLGMGVQRLDLADIMRFPASALADPVLDLQPALIMHEATEVFQSVARGIGFDAAHRLAINNENRELADKGSRGRRRPPPDTFTEVRDGTGTVVAIDARVGWRDINNDRIVAMIVRIDNALAVTNIRSGIFETGVTYDETDRDLRIGEIFLVEGQVIPEPSALALAATGLGVLALAGLRRRRGAAA
jgi:hypothetical protein